MKKLHSVLPSAADSKFVGFEPTWDPATFDEKYYIKEMMRGLNWHNYVAKDTDIHKYLIQWVSKFDPSNLSRIEDIPKSDVDSTIGAICRMHLQGFPLRPHHINHIVEHIAHLLKPNTKKKAFGGVEPENTTQESTPKKDPQKAMRQQVSSTLADIDEAIDAAFDKFEIDAPKVTEIILKKNYSPNHLNIVKKHLITNISEWNTAYDKQDDQLVQAYAYVPRRKFKTIIEGFTSVLETIQRFSESVSVKRKPRPVNKESLTKNLKFLTQFHSYKGLPATDVVSATKLWIYDTKYRKMICLTGEKKGLSAKGSSITGTISRVSKILRKPEEQLAQFTIQKNPQKWFEELTTKPSESGVQITKSMILLRVE